MSITLNNNKSLLVNQLKSIRKHDINENYDRRNELVMQAMATAGRLDYDIGIRIDEDEKEWPVVYIKLPTGQISWHLPQYEKEWDGHTNSEKYERIDKYIESVDR